MKDKIILKCSSFSTSTNIWECSNLSPLSIIRLLTDFIDFFSVDQNKKKINKINLEQVEEIIEDKRKWRHFPDLILLDNPFCKEVNEISSKDFDIIMNMFIDYQCSINTELTSIGNTMVLYAHDNTFYNVFYSHKFSVEDIVYKLLSLIFVDKLDNNINIQKTMRLTQLIQLLKNGILLNIIDSKIDEKTLVLNAFVHNDSNFGDLLFLHTKIDSFSNLYIDIG